MQAARCWTACRRTPIASLSRRGPGRQGSWEVTPNTWVARPGNQGQIMSPDSGMMFATRLGRAPWCGTSAVIGNPQDN